MNELLTRISSYNIFNYLVPGTLFWILGGAFRLLPDAPKDLVLQLAAFYLSGLVLSRIGSLLLEPLLKLVRFIRYRDYASYVDACRVDEGLKHLVEVSNTYRTLAATFLVLLIMSISSAVPFGHYIPETLQIPLGFAGLSALFCVSFRKQTSYVSRRIEATRGGSDVTR